MGSILRAQRAATFVLFLLLFLVDGPGTRDVNDLPDRSPGLARVHACAKYARGWGWAEGEQLVRATFMAEMQSCESWAFTTDSQGQGGGLWRIWSHRCTEQFCFISDGKDFALELCPTTLK